MNGTFWNIIVPRSSSDDTKRREFILNVLLVSTLFFSAVDFLHALIKGGIYQGLSLAPHISIMIIVYGLYMGSRFGFFKNTAYALVSVYFALTTYMLYVHGADLPQGLLMYVFIIVLSGILVGTVFACIMTALISLSLVSVTYLQLYGGHAPKLHWKSEPFTFGDTLVSVATFVLIAIASWLSNRELKKEKDSLEIRVEERTAELKKIQTEKMLQMASFSEFGRLSAGILHDLINPLTALSLNLNQASLKARSESSSTVKSYIEQATLATNRMENYVRIAKKQLQHQDIAVKFSPVEEIRQVQQILEHKARSLHVTVRMTCAEERKMYGNFISFGQVMANVIANAIDAYENYELVDGERRVDICLRDEENGDCIVSVQDYGSGIKAEDIRSVFDPFFTTKDPKSGTGIGLFIVKQIVQRDFDGMVDIQSESGVGTTCTITFPA
ncbi:MAG: HAMP domain-containing sensor histidine kinase [Candidatus Moranbacteria bacterium]|nr:HAMP domain-containing sensor histidine kinase [Candidatus Moranbacteria bacterium]